MTKTDIVTHLRLALALLTRLPLPHLPDNAFDRQAQAVWAFPLVGLVVGALAMGAGLVMLALGLPAAATAGLMLAVQICATGAMHEDGLADTADGLWGGWTRERRLEIMKDSQIGTYGVLALILSLGLRWSALTMIVSTSPWVVIAVAALSRAIMPAMMCWMPNARRAGLSHQVGTPTAQAAFRALALGAVLALACSGMTILLPALAALAVVFVLSRIAMAKIGGQTGDILGAAQQVGEITLLLALVASL